MAIRRLFSRKTTPVCSIILYDDARGKESQILFSEMNATPPASTNTNTNSLFPPFPIRYNKIYMIITIINMITLVPSKSIQLGLKGKYFFLFSRT